MLVRPGDLDRSRRFYRDVLGLAIYREFGPPDDPPCGVLPRLGIPRGLRARSRSGRAVGLQIRDVRAEHARLAAADVTVTRAPAAESWGLIEMWIEDPDGIWIVLIEVPADHPLRRDPRSASSPR
jgi:catechol 2,3-dioxygenase-like lactoylglutathione lyase family enzyme